MKLQDIDFDLVSKKKAQSASFSEKREILFSIGEKLKKDFIGIDSVIDRVIDSILPWYLMPDAMRRPHIICLWGMTGVGKTDLVRRLVKYLNFGDKFLEIQMTNTGAVGGGVFDSIQDSIEFSNLEPNAPGVIFLDEMQRYRSIDENGMAIRDIKRQDIWQLLSDGKFSSATRREALLELLYADLMYDWGAQAFGKPKVDYDDNDDIIDPPVKKRRSRKKSGTVGERIATLRARHEEVVAEQEAPVEKFKPIFNRGYTTARKIKKLVKCTDSIKEIMMWDDFKKEGMIQEAIKNLELFVGDDYSKLLIIISGNLDEAYAMAKSVSDADVDADVMYEFSKSITFIGIKSALLKRFAPEQIARFGNNHIIYPSLSKKAFEDVITKTLSETSDYIKSRYDIDVSFTESIRDFVYRNGVFPAQGVRPVFSTISGTIEGLIPNLLISASELDHKLESVIIDTDSGSKSFTITEVKTGNVILVKDIVGDIDKIKGNSDIDLSAIVAVHEVGHAIVYSALFGVAPVQIELNSASVMSKGFIGRHNVFENTEGILNNIAVGLGGLVAEKIVFGGHSAGSKSDIDRATEAAGNMIKQLGMGTGLYSRFAMNPPEGSENTVSTQDFSKDIVRIDEIMEEARRKAHAIITKYTRLLIEVVEVGISEKMITIPTFVSICEKHGLKIDILSSEHMLLPPALNQFKKFAMDNE